MKYAPFFVLAGCLGAQAHASDGPLASMLDAPDELSISASVRARVETIDGQFRPGRAEQDTMVSIKTTLAAEYDTGPLSIGGEIWDARAYGQSKLSSAGTGEVNALELVQAYVKVDLGTAQAGAARSTATLGRFTLDMGSRRLVSRQNFRNTTNAYTGAYVDWRMARGSRLQLLWAMPHIRLPETAEGIRDNAVVWDQETSALQLMGAHLTVPKVLGGSAEVYGFVLRERDAPDRLTRNRRLFTPGLRLFRKPASGRWDHDIEAAYQFGKIRETASAASRVDLDVSAWFGHGEIGYTAAQGWKPRISVHFDAASGDGGRPGKFGRFDTLYGARRFEFGPTSLYGPLGRANIISPGLRLDVAPSKRLDAFVMARSTWAESTRDSFSSTGVKDASASAGSFAGHQLEGRVRYWLIPSVSRLDFGVAHLFKGRLLETASNAPRTGDTTYAYLDVTFSL